MTKILVFEITFKPYISPELIPTETEEDFSIDTDVETLVKPATPEKTEPSLQRLASILSEPEERFEYEELEPVRPISPEWFGLAEFLNTSWMPYLRQGTFSCNYLILKVQIDFLLFFKFQRVLKFETSPIFC